MGWLKKIYKKTKGAVKHPIKTTKKAGKKSYKDTKKVGKKAYKDTKKTTVKAYKDTKKTAVKGYKDTKKQISATLSKKQMNKLSIKLKSPFKKVKSPLSKLHMPKFSISKHIKSPFKKAERFTRHPIKTTKKAGKKVYTDTKKTTVKAVKDTIKEVSKPVKKAERFTRHPVGTSKLAIKKAYKDTRKTLKPLTDFTKNLGEDVYNFTGDIVHDVGKPINKGIDIISEPVRKFIEKPAEKLSKKITKEIIEKPAKSIMNKIIPVKKAPGKTITEKRIGVAKRAYGVKASNGFRNQAEYDAALERKGLNYDANFKRYSLKSGVDYEAAKADWNNYIKERQEIARYNVLEERRKSAPDALSSATAPEQIQTTGVGGATGLQKKKKRSVFDASSSVASTSQALGIY